MSTERVHTVKDTIIEQTKHILDTVTVTGVIGHVLGWFTMPNIITLLTLVWAFSRAYKELTGEELHFAIKRWRGK